MKRIHEIVASGAVCLLVTVFLGAVAGNVYSHCDTMAGPVIQDAREALAKGDVTPVLKWVRPEHEAEIRNVFTNTLSVRREGADAGALADQYFFEILVRIHRAGEGAPYTGITDEAVDPVIAMAEEALGAGSADDMILNLKAHMETVVKEKFAAVSEAAKQKEKTVDLGRKYVAAYVAYMHYIEGLHAAMVASGAHAHDAGAAPDGHQE